MSYTQTLLLVKYKRRELKCLLIVSFLVMSVKASVILARAVDLGRGWDDDYFESWTLLGMQFAIDQDQTTSILYFQSFVNETFVLPATLCYLFYLRKLRQGLEG